MFIPKLPAAIFAVVLASNTFAHSGADDIIQIGAMGGGDEYIPVMRETATARFDIEPSDIGRPGQLVLIYQSISGPMAVLTPSGWKGFVSGLAEPLLYTPSLEPTYSVVFFDAVFYANRMVPEGFPWTPDHLRQFYGWNYQMTSANQLTDYSKLPGTVINARLPTYENSSLCGMLQQKGFGNGTIYAAYGALQPEAEESIERFHAVKNPKLSPEHLRDVYIELDGRKGHKYSAVIDVTCSGPAENFSGG